MDEAYYAAVASGKELGATRGIDAVLQKFNLDALILPSDGTQKVPTLLAWDLKLFVQDSQLDRRLSLGILLSRVRSSVHISSILLLQSLAHLNGTQFPLDLSPPRPMLLRRTRRSPQRLACPSVSLSSARRGLSKSCLHTPMPSNRRRKRG